MLRCVATLCGAEAILVLYMYIQVPVRYNILVPYWVPVRSARAQYKSVLLIGTVQVEGTSAFASSYRYAYRYMYSTYNKRVLRYSIRLNSKVHVEWLCTCAVLVLYDCMY